MRGRIAAMADALAHRGPDDAGFIDLAGAALANTRLAIQDPAHGHQPMVSSDRRVAVVFNGEIYNYPDLRRSLEAEGVRFRTDCDTEVLLHLYRRRGSDLVHELDGMFALAVWDVDARSLLLARDHMGQKPLYWCRVGSGIAFASEIKALMAAGLVGSEPDMQALYHYMSLRFIPDDRTLLHGVSKLPAAHQLTLEGDSIAVRPYWRQDRRPELQGTDDQIIEQLDEKLGDVIQSHLLSDVPVGCFLSGGIDSSLITALACKRGGGEISTFAVGVEEDDYNELPWARRVARQYGTRHAEEVASADLVELLPRMVWHLEEPADPFGVGVYLVSRLASRHVKVVLSGDGGDELFAGYDRYWGNRLADMYRLVPSFLRQTVLKRLTEATPDSFGYKGTPEKLRWIHRMAEFDGGARYAESMSFLRFSESQKQNLFSADVLADLGEGASTDKIISRFQEPDGADLVYRMLHTDLTTRIPDHLLPLVDRMSMAHGLEVRAPFMEHRLVDFAMRIPSRLKVRRGVLKYALRRVAARHLDQEIISRPKQGFGFPLARWLAGELRPVLEETVGQSGFAHSGIFERDYLQQLLTEHVSGSRDHNFRLWMILNLEVWRQLFVEGQDVEHTVDWIRTLQGARNGQPQMAV
jgi:asparagine synthase (glutamine-hydrolysing)